MKKLLAILIPIFIFTACEKLLFGDTIPSDYTTTFEYFLQRTNEHYCCFDIAGVDWNQVYADYAPQVSNDMTEASFIELIDEMLSLLKDHNLSVTTPFSEIRYSEYELHPTNLDTNTVKLYNPTNQPYVAYDSVAYVNRFNDGYYYSDENGTYSFDFFEGTMNRARNKNLKGVILDFRSLLLPSGNAYNTIEITPHDFIRIGEQRPVGIARRKIGPALNDFEERVLDETFDGSGYEGPIIILINYQMFAANNNTYNAFRTAELSNTILMGTGIGSGNFYPLSTSTLPNGWLLSIPEVAIFDIQGNSIGLGIQPDTIVVDDAITTDIDEVIEAALDMLR